MCVCVCVCVCLDNMLEQNRQGKNGLYCFLDFFKTELYHNYQFYLSRHHMKFTSLFDYHFMCLK